MKGEGDGLEPWWFVFVALGSGWVMYFLMCASDVHESVCVPVSDLSVDLCIPLNFLTSAL